MAVTSMEWRDLLSVRRWSPLSALSCEARHLDDTLYAVGEEKYLLAVPYGKNLIRTPEGPFVTMAIWAESAGAARRATLMEIERDEVDGGSIEPPFELLVPAHGASKYDGIRKAATRPGCERGQYRVAGDGRFIQKVIEIGPATYCFRSATRLAAESPYVIFFALTE
jgi:hypothetical protein